ncbi:hypothetical protein [Saccharolobus islandicus]|nr:hypothetical protein [Sulfolobus islandicus]
MTGFTDAIKRLHAAYLAIVMGIGIISIVKPSVVIAPYYVIKTLKEWDLIVHSEKIVNEQLIVTITNNLCEEKVIGINPYDISSKLFQKKLITECVRTMW